MQRATLIRLGICVSAGDRQIAISQRVTHHYYRRPAGERKAGTELSCKPVGALSRWPIVGWRQKRCPYTCGKGLLDKLGGECAGNATPPEWLAHADFSDPADSEIHKPIAYQPINTNQRACNKQPG